MTQVCIVVLNWNGWSDTIECVRSLQKQNYKNFSLLVVDNGSTDGSVEKIRQALPDIDLIPSGRNLGFGGGCNIGMRRALALGAEYIWLINSDALADPDALGTLVRQAEQFPSLGAVGSVLYEPDHPGQVQLWGGGKVQLWWGSSRHLSCPGRLDFVSGASALLRCKALEAIGLFDEKSYFMYWEDTDLSFRLRAAGWAIGVAQNAKVWHRESSSLGKGSPQLDLYFTQSAIRFLRKYAKYPLVPISMMLTRMFLKRLLLRDWRRVQAVIQGYRQA
jgi:GT2 family glycosyltransferase